MIIEYWRSEENVFFNWDKIILDLQDPLVDYTTSQYHLITQPPYPTDGLVPLNLANLNFLTNIALTQPIELNIHTAFMQQLNALLVPANGLFSAEEPHSLGEIGLDLDSYLQALAAQATQATQATGITFDQQNQAAPPPPKPRSRRAARRVVYHEYASSADEAAPSEAAPSEASKQSSHKRDPALNSTQLADLVSTLRNGQAFSPKQTRLLGSSSLAVYSKICTVPGITPEIHEELRAARRKIRNSDSARKSRNKRAEYKTSMYPLYITG